MSEQNKPRTCQCPHKKAKNLNDVCKCAGDCPHRSKPQ